MRAIFVKYCKFQQPKQILVWLFRIGQFAWIELLLHFYVSRLSLELLRVTTMLKKIFDCWQLQVCRVRNNRDYRDYRSSGGPESDGSPAVVWHQPTSQQWITVIQYFFLLFCDITMLAIMWIVMTNCEQCKRACDSVEN